jgi:hypothetical protein
MDQPADSRIVVDDLGDVFTLRVPPAGFWKGSAGLGCFAVFWNGFMAVFTIAAMFGALQNGDWRGAIFFAGFIALFWAVGIGIFLAAVNMGRREAAIAIVDDQISVLQTGMFGSKKQQWTADQLSTIRVGPSGMEVNDKPVMQLQFVPREGKHFGMLTGRAVPELEWLAATLRQRLSFPDLETARGVVLADRAIPPAASQIVDLPMSGGASFDVPPLGWNGMTKSLAIIGGVIIAVVLVVVAGIVIARSAEGQLDIGFLIRAIVFGGFFAFLGLVCLAIGIQVALGRAAIAVSHGQLMIAQAGPLRSKQRQWDGTNLAAIRVGPSGTQMNNQDLPELQIVPQGGKKVGLFAGRDQAELEWLATRLRQLLNVPALTSEEAGENPAINQPEA